MTFAEAIPLGALIISMATYVLSSRGLRNKETRISSAEFELMQLRMKVETLMVANAEMKRDVEECERRYERLLHILGQS